MKRGRRELLIAVSIVAVLIFVSGQEGCQGFQLGGGGTQASKTGLDYSLTSGMDYLTSGKTLQQGESFYVGVKLENYDKVPRSGELCISDNVLNDYGGIGDDECRAFNIKAAEITKKQVSGIMTSGSRTEESIVPGTAEFIFPEGAEYNYYGLPSMTYGAGLSVSARYLGQSRASGTLTTTTEQLSMTQEPAPVLVSVTKSVHRRQDNYKIDLDISLTKKQQATIHSPDFSKENITYFRIDLPFSVECATTDGKAVAGFVELESERLIKCSGLVPVAEKASYPLVITLDYGVELEREYPFSIKVETSEE